MRIAIQLNRHLTMAGDPSDTQVSYTRDTMGRITAVTEKPSGGASATVVSSVAYEPFGPDTGFRTGSAGQETRSFDQDYRLTNVTDLGTVRRGVTRVLENLSYAYYPTNNVQTITDAVTSGKRARAEEYHSGLASHRHRRRCLLSRFVSAQIRVNPERGRGDDADAWLHR
jgi:hypothetical protein